VNEATERLGSAPAPQPKGTLSGQVSRAMLWNATLQPLRLLAGLLSGIVVTNVLSADAYGTIARLSAMAATLGLFVDLGVERGLVKFLPEIEARYGRAGVRNALWIVIAQKLAILVVAIGLMLVFRERFFDFWRRQVAEQNVLALLDAHRWVFFWALVALIVFGAVFDVYMQALTAYFRQRASGSIGIVTTLLKPLLLIAVVLVGWGVLGVVGAMVAIPIVATLLAAWRVATIRRDLKKRPTQPTAGARLVPRFAAYCGLSYWIQITEYFYSVDFVVLAIPAAAAAAGFKFTYSIVAQLLAALWSPMVGVQIPLFARLHSRNDDRQLASAYTVLSKFLAVLLIPAAIGLALLAHNLIATINPKYSDFDNVARILTICLCLDAAISVPLSILMAYERYRPMLIARTAALVAVPLVLIVAPHYGVAGAALVMGGTRLMCDSLAMALALRALPIRYPTAFAARVTGAAMLMALAIAPFALTLLRPPGGASVTLRLAYLAGNGLLAGIGGLVFFGLFKLTGGLDPEDRRRVAELRLPVATRLLRFL
jgi:O-antigen/teichoic acid export membrane protein